jgi:membrane protease subunit HflK
VDRIQVDQVRHMKVGYEQGSDAAGPMTPPGQMLTGDHNLVNLQVAIDYSVLGAEVEHFAVQQDRIEGLVARAADTVLAEWIGSRTVDEVLVSGKVVLPRLLVTRTQERLEPYRLGVQVRSASVLYLAPPDEVKHAFDAVNRAQTEIGTTINRAHKDAESQLRVAQAKKYQLEQQAAAYAAEQRWLAEADAEAFEKRLAVYQEMGKQNPAYLNGIWWAEMGKLFAQLKKNGQLDLLDRHLGSDGLDITVMPPLPKKR